MVHVIGVQNSIANQFLFELRDRQRQQDPLKFRHNLERLGEIMAYEISKNLGYSIHDVKTPLGKTGLALLDYQPVLIPILRAGLPYFAGFQNFFDQAKSGFVGAYRRDEDKELSIQLDYLAAPDLSDKDVVIIDPMLATGQSVTETIKQISKRGQPRHIYLASVVASPEGIQHLKDEVKFPFSIWTFAVDEKLNHRFYIVPGLGDAGDLSFGEKL